MGSSTVTNDRRSFLVVLETRKDGATVTSIEPRIGNPTPEDFYLGCLGGLAAVYVATCDGSEDDLTPAEFSTLVAAKLQARLADYAVGNVAKPRSLQ